MAQHVEVYQLAIYLELWFEFDWLPDFFRLPWECGFFCMFNMTKVCLHSGRICEAEQWLQVHSHRIHVTNGIFTLPNKNHKKQPSMWVNIRTIVPRMVWDIFLGSQPTSNNIHNELPLYLRMAGLLQEDSPESQLSTARSLRSDSWLFTELGEVEELIYHKIFRLRVGLDGTGTIQSNRQPVVGLLTWDFWSQKQKNDFGRASDVKKQFRKTQKIWHERWEYVLRRAHGGDVGDVGEVESQRI